MRAEVMQIWWLSDTVRYPFLSFFVFSPLPYFFFFFYIGKALKRRISVMQATDCNCTLYQYLGHEIAFKRWKYCFKVVTVVVCNFH